MDKRDAYNLILKCNSWADFVHEVSTLETTTDLGDAFERLTQLQMLTDPLYRAVYKNIWMAKQSDGELPKKVREHLNLTMTDEGIDLIAETHHGTYASIQAKYRTDEKRLNVRELSTFANLSFRNCTNIDDAIVRTNANPPQKKDLLRGVRYEKLDTYLRMDKENSEGWKRIHAFINGLNPPKLTPKQPRPYQQEAIDNAVNYFQNNQSRGRLIMPCATGKSLIAYWIHQALDVRTVLIAVPSLALINQTIDDWTMQAALDDMQLDFLGVCSDERFGVVKRDPDSFDDSIADVRVPCTTDPARISTFIQSHPERTKVLITTYHSGEAASTGIRSAGATIDLAIMDEAHKTVGAANKTFSHLLFDENIAIKKRLFMTATERQLRTVRNNVDVVSMDDDSEVFG